MLLYACVSYISVAGTKYHDHSKLEKEELIWAYTPREIRVHHGRLSRLQTGKAAKEGSRKITYSSTSMRWRMGGKWCEIINTQSPPLVPYFPPTRPFLPNGPQPSQPAPPPEPLKDIAVQTTAYEIAEMEVLLSPPVTLEVSMWLSFNNNHFSGLFFTVLHPIFWHFPPVLSSVIFPAP